MSVISICMIAKNEEEHLPTFFKSLEATLPKGFAEVIFIDTGSTDASREIAASHHAQVYDFAWANDFSKARNFSISKATNEWILILDCDEYLTAFDSKTVREFMQTYSNGLGDISLRNRLSKNGEFTYDEEHLPRFFSKKYYHFEYSIHEQILPLSVFTENRFILPIEVIHVGYDISPEVKKQKCKRNSELLLQEIEKDPDNPYWYFQLGQSAFSIQDYTNACEYFQKGFSFDVNPADSLVITSINSYGHSLIALNRLEEALLFENIYEDFKNSADFVCMMGEIYFHNKMYLKAMQEFLLATTFDHSQVAGANSFIPYYNMGVINEMHGNLDAAISYYQKCGDFSMAKERLKTLHK